MNDTVSITAITIYPIKSCSGITLPEARCMEYGLENDRAWAIADFNGKLITQREEPRLLLIQPDLTAGAELILQAQGQSSFHVQTGQNDIHPLKLSVWGDERDALEECAGASAWISTFLGYPCRLVRRLGTLTQTSISGEPSAKPPSLLFTDSRPLLVMAEETLNDLNQRLAKPVTMDRFRPSIVIAGLNSYEEDQLLTLSGMSAVITASKPCARCVIVNIDQVTGTKEMEPLRTLAQYRTVNGKTMLGYYFTITKTGYASLGETLNCEFKADAC